MSSWHLDNVEELRDKYPDSFFIPSETRRRSLKTGDLVRLQFVAGEAASEDSPAERLWVQVIATSGDQAGYRGVITHKPEIITDLSPDDEIAFEACHVARVQLTPKDEAWLDCGEKTAIVSSAVLEPGAFARYAYREHPDDDDDDSGWRLFEGSESDEFLDDMKNICLSNIYWLSERDPSLLALLDQEAPIAFERERPEDPWVPAPTPDAED